MKTRKICSLGDYLAAVADEASNDDKSSDKTKPEVLWFRGQSQKRFDLIPSLYRSYDIFGDIDSGFKYTKRHFVEDIRIQNYIAKNYHYFEKLPSSKVEWIEVMQHHEMKTRALDWSESSIHSILFALEPFLDAKKYSTDVRRHQNPCVWILKPLKLNRNLFKILLEDEKLCFKLAEELYDENHHFPLNILNKTNTLCETLTNHSNYGKGIWHIQEIINLSAVNDELTRERGRLKKMIENEEFYPLFYFLSRIYSDGYLLQDRQLPPLAVVEPYHSERIRFQRGVFTIFPHYSERKGDNDIRGMGIDPNAMQRNKAAEESLVLLELERPEQIAYELLSNGIQTSWLYPELPIVANELEGHTIF